MSKKFAEYKKFDLSEINKEINVYWKKNRIFEQSVETREGRPTFVFNEGPPSANGIPGIHHVMARTIKDLFCRYKTHCHLVLSAAIVFYMLPQFLLIGDIPLCQ